MALKLLDKMRPGEKGKIVKIRGKPDMHRQLSRMGLLVGRFICVENPSSSIDVCTIIMSNERASLSVDLAQAANVYVDLT